MKIHVTGLLLAMLALPVFSQAAAQPGRDASGVFQRWEPTPAATPVAKKKLPQGTTVSFHKPSWAVALKGGLGLPLGETSEVTNAGFSGGVDVYFRAASMLSMDLFGLYTMAPYKDSRAAEPLYLVGGGVRALYHPFKMDKMLPHIGGGLGYMSARRATAVPVLDAQGNPTSDPVTNEAITTVVYESGGGLVFTGAVGATYEIVERVGLQVELSVYSVSLAGGTSDSILSALTGVGIQYSF